MKFWNFFFSYSKFFSYILNFNFFQFLLVWKISFNFQVFQVLKKLCHIWKKNHSTKNQFICGSFFQKNYLYQLDG